MTVNFKYRLLEGVRSADSNNPLTFPARSVISDSTAFQSENYRSDYMVWVTGTASDYDIGHPDLSFGWTKNEPGISRFDWDGFSGRWDTLPGSGEESVGKIGQSDPIFVPVPAQYSFDYAPYALYVGSPEREISFLLDLVSSSDDFTNPPPGTVQISVADGEVRFSTADWSNPILVDRIVYVARQSFLDRQVATGRIGFLPEIAGSPTFLFLRPIPGTNQYPRIQIGNQPILRSIVFPVESSMPVPQDSGIVHISGDTGRVLFADAAVSANLGREIYYRGVQCGTSKLRRIAIGQFPNTRFYPSAIAQLPDFLDLSDQSRFLFCLESPDGLSRYYYNTTIGTTPPFVLLPGSIWIKTTTGECFISHLDSSSARPGTTLYAIDTYATIEHGVSVQMNRSGGSGVGVPDVPDFKRVYSVTEQIQTNNIQGSPLFLLTTLPQEDDRQTFAVRPSSGSSGTFSGVLNRAEDSNLQGIGFKIDYAERSIVFANRKTSMVLLAKTDYSFVAPNSAILSEGFQVYRNGVLLSLGQDFIVNTNGGTIEFVEPRGLGDSSSILGIRGQASGNIVEFTSGLPSGDLSGRFFAVYSGPNSGIYLVRSSSGTRLTLDGPPMSSGIITGDLVFGAETLVDRVWETLSPVFRKISIRAYDGSIFTDLKSSDFGILPTSGQISLQRPAGPGNKYRVSYSYFPQDENGGSLPPISVQEWAAFPIFQETATIESGKIRFNPIGRNVVLPDRTKVFVNGITLEDFRIEGNKIECGQTFTNENVTINYFVDSAIGGESSFVLANPSLDVDFPHVYARPEDNSGAHLILNGQVNWTTDTPVLIGDAQVFLVQSCTFVAGQSKVIFKNSPVEDVINPRILFSRPLPASRFFPIGLPQSALVKGSKELILQGDARPSLRADQFVKIHSDYFQVSTISYDVGKNTSTVTLSTAATKNYIVPAASHTVLPVVSPTSTLFTTSALVSQIPPVVSRMSTVESTILAPGIDYTISEGGGIELSSPVQNGDTIRCLYLARRLEPAGTQFDINFAYQIAPNADNGIRGQSLLATYNLHNPDTFFFRVETVETYIPDLMEYIGQSSGSGTSSGPNIGNNYSSKMQNNGLSSPYFEEQHLDNMDSVAAQILLVYNDVVNGFEDFLSNLDGRVVGGTDGKFRFDGIKTNPDRANYRSVTNDIDDRILINEPLTISFSTVPAGIGVQGGNNIYKDMWDTHARSRFYPTEKRNAAVVLNDQTNGFFDFNVTLGNFGVNGLLSHDPLITARSRWSFTVFLGLLRVDGVNGDGPSMVPPVKVGQIMEVYTDRGMRLETVGSIYPIPVRIQITNISPYEGGFLLGFTEYDSGDPITLPITTGSILRLRSEVDNDDEDAIHSYNDDYVSVNHGDGSVHFKWTPGPFGPDGKVWGKEIMSSTIAFFNTDTSPRRPPVFDGGTLLDNGQVSEPLLSHENELRYLKDEKQALTFVYSGVAAGFSITSPSTPGVVNDQYMWVTGSNSGGVFTINAIAGGNWSVTPSQPATSAERFILISRSGLSITPRIQSAWDGLIRVLSTNMEAPIDSGPTPWSSPELVNAIGSEFQSLNRILEAAGTTTLIATGSTSGTTLTDNSTEFGVDVDVQIGQFIWIQDPAAFGIYKITGVTPHAIEIGVESPYVSFRAAGTFQYRILRPWDFLNETLFDQIAACAQFTHSFLTDTQNWINSFSAASDLSSRNSRIESRIQEISAMTQSIQSCLSTSEALYESRYVWIQQRINRKDGLVSLGGQARTRRQEQIQKIQSTQRKLKTLQKL